MHPFVWIRVCTTIYLYAVISHGIELSGEEKSNIGLLNHDVQLLHLGGEGQSCCPFV